MIRAALARWKPAVLAGLALVGLVPAGAHAVDKAPIAVSADKWAPNEDDSWLFDVRSGQYRLGDGVRGYQTPQGICVDLGDVVLALDLAVRVDKKLRRATGWVFDERRSLTIDRDAGEVRAGSQSFRLTPAMIRDTPAGWCVDLDSLNIWLGVPLAADLSNAVLRIDTKDKLPFQLAAERRARAAAIRPQGQFDLASLPQAARPYQAWAAPSVDVVASAGFVSDKRGGSYVQGRYEIFAAGEVLGQSFDARLSSDNEGVPDSLRMRLYRTDPQGQLLGPLKATHYAVGDVSLLSTGIVASSAPGRGAVLTNRPVERPDSFDKTTFRGDLPAGMGCRALSQRPIARLHQSERRWSVRIHRRSAAIWREPLRDRALRAAGADPARNPAGAGGDGFDPAAANLVLGGVRAGKCRSDRIRQPAAWCFSPRLAWYARDRARARYADIGGRLFSQPDDRECSIQLWRGRAAALDRADLARGRRQLCRQWRRRRARELACGVRRNLCACRCDARLGRFVSDRFINNITVSIRSRSISR
jgi:hypothetical protein